MSPVLSGRASRASRTGRVTVPLGACAGCGAAATACAWVGRPRSVLLPPLSRTTFNRPENCVHCSPVNVSAHTRSARKTPAVQGRCPAQRLVQHALLTLGFLIPPLTEGAALIRARAKPTIAVISSTGLPYLEELYEGLVPRESVL